MQPHRNHEGGAWKWWLAGCLGLIVFLNLSVVVGVVAFYAEEDWRGGAALEKARSEVEDDGTSLDPTKYIPAPIPDAANFGALPIFKTSPAPDTSHEHPYLEATALKGAIEAVIKRYPNSKEEEKTKNDSLPYLEKWTSGAKPDMDAVRSRLATIANAGKTKPFLPNANATDSLAKLCPALADLRAETETHPQCLFRLDYDLNPPTKISFSPITTLISLTKVFAYDERLALYENNGSRTLDDMSVSWKIVSGLQKQPLLISALTARGITEMQLRVLQQGLASHVWNDSQLDNIDALLGKFDFLTNEQFAIAGDVVVFDLPSIVYYRSHRWLTPEELSILREEISFPPLPPNYLGRIVYWLTPAGWIDMDTALELRLRFLGTIKIIDPAARRVYPDKDQALAQSYENVYSHVFWDKKFYDPEGFGDRSVKTCAYTQVHIDEARIACRLERYRLRHGAYPGSLSDLVAISGSESPHDVLSGDRYHYQFLPDGNYLLYSVGWDQEDDGGKSAAADDKSPLDAPDWVWPSHSNADGGNR